MKTLINYCISLLACLALMATVPAHAQVNYDKITYIHSDASGTPIAASDEQGDIVWSIDHYPYGAEYSNDANNRAGSLSFAGKAYDEETGLSYFGGRWYNAHVGRFMGIDPAPVDSEDWRTFNRYSYGFNNPYKYLDPDGWEPIDPHADTDSDGIPNFAEASYVKVDNVLGTGLNVSQGTLALGIGMANGKVSDVLKGNATKRVTPSIKDQAKDIKHTLNNDKNTVTVRSGNKETHFDLDGPTHKGVETPHKQFSHPNTNSQGQTFFNKDRKTVEPMTQQDIRTVKKVLQKRNKGGE